MTISFIEQGSQTWPLPSWELLGLFLILLGTSATPEQASSLESRTFGRSFLFQQPLHIVITSWMILSNAWHGLQRLARKRNFHRLVWHSGCCLSFNGHKREILQDTIEVIWSLLSILPAFCEGTYLFWKAKSVDKPYVMWLLLSAAIARSYY